MTEIRSDRGGRAVRNREHLRTDNAADKDDYFTQKMKEFKHYQKFQMGQDFDNLLSEDVIEKMAAER